MVPSGKPAARALPCAIVAAMHAPRGHAPRLAILATLAVALLGARRAPDGTLVIRSLTEGATIHVDGRPAGTLPMPLPLALSPGEHTVRVAKPGHADYIDTFTIRPGRETLLEIDLLAMSGALAVSTRPRGAGVYIDGRYVGDAPWRGDAEAGARIVEVRAPGHAPWRQVLELPLGEEQVIDVQLAPAASAAAPADDAWYAEPLVWIGVGAALTAGVVAVVLVTADDERPRPDASLVIETVR